MDKLILLSFLFIGLVFTIISLIEYAYPVGFDHSGYNHDVDEKEARTAPATNWLHAWLSKTHSPTYD